MFKKILIANRGEIALRIIRACKELSIESVAIYSEADKTSPHTKYADEAYYIGDSPSSESYLNQNKIISLAKEVGVDAVHPGYGFFSENAGFIEEIENTGITFIGPSSASVKMMGLKTASRQLMSQNNVPIVPGTTSHISSVNDGIDEAKRIGYPIIIKAAAGGGGKGMKLVTNQKEFTSSFESAQREALKFFADDSVYIEKYIENPKHIEVQIFGDKLGNYVHIFERECSIQRRHQKIIEEAPSSLDDKTRKKITQAAISAAKACGYYNAGTIEFLVDKNSNFYFLEMNTRLQVEHPVTEMICGIDLVKEQIKIAAGSELSFKQEDIKVNGHAIEVRVYAEDPENNFLPSTGKLLEFLAPSGPGIRLDAGFSRGSLISIYYDPLIAKLIGWGKTREEAIGRLKRALGEFQIAGVTTNISLLKAICNNDNFIKGKFDINFLEKEFADEFQIRTAASKEIENAVVICASLLKVRNSSAEIKNIIPDNNKWAGLQYE